MPSRGFKFVGMGNSRKQGTLPPPRTFKVVPNKNSDSICYKTITQLPDSPPISNSFRSISKKCVTKFHSFIEQSQSVIKNESFRTKIFKCGSIQVHSGKQTASTKQVMNMRNFKILTIKPVEKVELDKCCFEWFNIICTIFSTSFIGPLI